MRQPEPPPTGKTRWECIGIDKSWSQGHCLHFADLDGAGQPEVITGKHVRAYDKIDPGAADPPCLCY